MFPPLKLIALKLQLWGLKRKAAAQKATLAKRQAVLGEKWAENAELKEGGIRNLLSLIGGMTLFWAKLESRLDHLNELAFLNGAQDVIDREIPRALDRKLAFMKRAHSRLPWLLALKPEGLRVVQAFKGLRDDRHQLIHGAVDDIGTDDELKFVRHIHGAGPLQLDVQEFSPERFLDITTRMSELSKLVREHHMAMNDALLQYRLD